MNLALHGFLLQVILSILNFKHGFRLCSAGEPDYLDFDNLPETNFSCQGKVIGGYYADVEAGCQMFHVCTIGQKDEIMDIKFLCLNGTVFDQETRVCERVDEVDCSKSEQFYNLNLELYGNNAVTLSLHEEEDDDGSTEPREEHQQQQQQQHMTSARPSTTSTTTTTTSRPSQPSTTSASNVYQQHPTGYPQHYQPRPVFPQVQTSQSNTHYDDKNGGYHHQYIFHSDERNNNNNQATSYQLFSNQGVSSTTPTPQVHQQIRYSSTASPQVIHSEPSTVTPIQYHVQSTSSTIQTLLNSNANNPSLINSLFHNHGIASTTEQFNHNNPREIAEYEDDSEDEQDERNERKPLEAIQSTNKGKVSKLTISPVPHENRQSVIHTKSSQSSQQQRISVNYLPTPAPIQTTINAFYPTQRSTSQNAQKSQNNQQVTQHIHVLPPPPIPQLKPHQVTITIPPSDIQRIVQNPSPLLPSQSRVIVTAKASVSDESGRPLNTSQLITLPLPKIPLSYDDYKEGDESFDPFYQDVPKIRNDQRIVVSRKVVASERSIREKRSTDYKETDESYPSEEVIFNAEIKDIKDLKANLPIIKAILFGLPFPQSEGSPSNTANANTENADKSNKSLQVGSQSEKDIENSQRVTTKRKSAPKDVKSATSQNEEEYVDVEISVPVGNDEKNTRISNLNSQKTDTQQTIGHQIPSSVFQQQISFNPIIVEHDKIDPKSKGDVQLFLGINESNNSIYSNRNISVQIDAVNHSNGTVDLNDKTDKVKQELLQTRSSSNSNKSNRRKVQNPESIEESEEYEPRRNSRITKPKASRYYDEYDTSESIETSSRQRFNRLRQRPKDRRVINYRDDYVDEEDIDDDEYDDESISRNHKSTSRRGPQGRRISYRNRNRHVDYEDDVEVHEKPRVRTKTLNTSSKIRNRPQSSERFFEERGTRPEVERRKNRRRRPSTSEDAVNKAESINSQIIGESDLKASKDIDPPGILVENKKISSKYSLKSEQDKPLQASAKKRPNSLERDKDFVEEQKDHSKEDYSEQQELYSDEYNESVEDIYEDYIDYGDLEDQIGRTPGGTRGNKNRFDDELEIIPERKSERRDKSRKFIDEAKLSKEKVEEKTEHEDIESTTIPDEQGTKTTTVPVEYAVTDEANVSQEYDDYSSTKMTSKIEDTANTESPEQIKTTVEDVSTEGVFKFTDELPRTDKKDDVQENQKGKDKETKNEEDYVDDNYEPESYTDPKVKEPIPPVLASKEETEKHVLTLNDQPAKNTKLNDNRTRNSSAVKTESKDEYDETYEDRQESTTISLTSEEYDDLETTTDTILTSTISTRIPTSTAVSTSTSTIKTTSTTTTTITSTTTTTPLPVTITTTSTSTTTTSAPLSSTSVVPRTKPTIKFFKPIGLRKNYAYSPPSTSPNPVVIRRGQPLAGPKPTKPPPSYNELAPKPVIRRLPLLSRTTTTTSEATLLEEKIAEELSKHLAEETNKNIDKNNNSASGLKNIPSSSPESISIHIDSKSSSTVKSNEITIEEFDVTTMNPNNQIPAQDTTTAVSVRHNQTLNSKEQNFDNEVPKQSLESNDSNNVPHKAVDSVAETSKAEAESTTFNEGLSKSETTTRKADFIYKMLDVQTTTVKNFRPSEQGKLELTSVKSQIQRSKQGPKRSAGFNCLEKEMYRFYGDSRDCRLFHYCSPGFTARQVLDFRFVCEEGTIFDEESQSCRHDVANHKCVKRTW